MKEVEFTKFCKNGVKNVTSNCFNRGIETLLMVKKFVNDEISVFASGVKDDIDLIE